jgi:hypothetical protein
MEHYDTRRKIEIFDVFNTSSLHFQALMIGARTDRFRKVTVAFGIIGDTLAKPWQYE